ncbi:DUF309 domain-containing protein [Halobacillus sp. H74]|uniref:DUF309 domain-containing protein n=1 Tax=Halobacillus sp. H74 TaxID=3457436 RepID=UPI003FCCFB3C
MYPTVYIEYLAHFHGTRDYFECHEVLEEYWKEVDPKNRNSVWVLLIQIAVSMYHDRRGNQKGARILLNRCLHKFPENHIKLKNLGLDPEHLLDQLHKTDERLKKGESYTSWNFPIIDLQLRQEVHSLCQKWQVAYGAPSDMSDDWLVWKHKLRNRE